MEQKHVFLSALSVGVGLGVGLGLSSGQAVQKWVGGNRDFGEVSEDQIVVELKRLLVDGKDSKVTFDEFPYYLSERTRVLLTSAAYVHLKHLNFSKHTRNLSPASRAILLSGPAELYQQMLAKALAHYFESKLLLLDVTDFSVKLQSRFGYPSKEPCHRRSISEMTLEGMSGLFGSFSTLPSTGETRGTLRQQRGESSNNLPRLRRNASAASDLSSSSSQSGLLNPGPLRRTSSMCFDERLFVQSLYKVLVSISGTDSVILYIRDVEKLLLKSPRLSPSTLLELCRESSLPQFQLLFSCPVDRVKKRPVLTSMPPSKFPLRLLHSPNRPASAKFRKLTPSLPSPTLSSPPFTRCSPSPSNPSQPNLLFPLLHTSILQPSLNHHLPLLNPNSLHHKPGSQSSPTFTVDLPASQPLRHPSIHHHNSFNHNQHP